MTLSNKKSTDKPRAKAEACKVPTPNELAASFGVTLDPPLKPAQIQRFRRALPGYVGLLDDVAELLREDADNFEVAGVTPETLLEAQAQQKFLAAREGVVQAVHRSIYEQRLQADDVGMKMLEKVARRISALKEDDPTLTVRYKILLDFLGTFRNGGAKAAPAESEQEPNDG